MKLKRKRKHTTEEWIFYLVIVVPCVIQVAIFYFYASFDSLLLAFQSYNPLTGKFIFSGLETWKVLIEELFAEGMGVVWGRSALMCLISYGTLIVNIAISWFLYKKIPFAGFFKVILFLPSILPGTAMILFYKNFMELNIGPQIISGNETAFRMLILYGLWLGFGSGMITYCGLFARISPELEDAIKIDGGNRWTEFVNLGWPAIYPLVTVGLYTGLGSIFSITPNTYAFFGNMAPESVHTIGYIFYSKIAGKLGTDLYSSYCLTSAASLLFGIVAAIPSFLLKGYFEKHDPNY